MNHIARKNTKIRIPIQTRPSAEVSPDTAILTRVLVESEHPDRDIGVRVHAIRGTGRALPVLVGTGEAHEHALHVGVAGGCPGRFG